jgi:16S rRNA (uracil1498-N3)-methyltransferase
MNRQEMRQTPVAEGYAAPRRDAKWQSPAKRNPFDNRKSITLPSQLAFLSRPMPRRFYLPQSLESPTIRLTGPEAHHLGRVLRFQTGDEVTLFDGKGAEARARIESIAADVVELTVLERSIANELPENALTVASAVPKGERFDWLVEKATELGVARLIPLITTRSVVHPGDSKLERLRRTIIEASKQCGRSRLMELTPPIEWKKLVEAEFTAGEVWIADPSGEPLTRSFGERSRPRIVAVGPEGGFTNDELELAGRDGAKLVGLGPRILRIETAAITLAVIAATPIE